MILGNFNLVKICANEGVYIGYCESYMLLQMFQSSKLFILQSYK